MLSKSLSFPGFITATLYTWGLCSLLIKFYVITISPVVAFALILIALSAICFVFYNRITISILFAVFLPAYALIVISDRSYFKRTLEGLYWFFADNISFFFGSSYDAEYASNHTMMITGLICLFIAIPAIFLCSRLRGATFLGLIAFGLFMVVWTYGVNSYYIELCVIICSVITVSAGSFARARAALNKDRIYEKTLFSYASAREPGIREGSILAGVVLPVTLIVSVCMLLILPKSVYQLHSISFETLIDDLIDLTGLYSGATRERIFFSLSEFGYNQTLGGPVSLSPDPVYTVSMSAPSLFRVTVKDVYTGYSWDKSPNANVYRFDYAMASEIRQEIYSENLPEGYYPEAVYIRSGGIGGPAVVTFTLVCPGPRSELLHSGRPTGFVSDTVDEFIPYFDTNSEIFSKRLLYEGCSYTMYERTLPFTNNRFNNYVIACEERLRKETPPGAVADPYAAAVRERYLGLPDSVEPWIYAFAREAAGNEDSNYKKVLSIRNAVAGRSLYTLTPAEVPAGREFVGWFLETKEGYCNYYATAMAVLCRCVGIPSRYVEGFSTFAARPKPNGSYVLTGEEAHSWCEVYIDGVGWIPMDATVGFYSSSGGSAVDSIEDDWSLIDFGTVEYDIDEPFAGIQLPPGAGLIFTAGLLMLFALTLIFMIARARWRFSFGRLKNKHSMGDILLIYWRDIRKIMPLIGIEPVIGETPSKEAVRLTALINENNKYSGALSADRYKLTEIASAVERYVYGEIEPLPREVESLYSLQKRLDSALMIQLLPFAYISQRRKWART